MVFIAIKHKSIIYFDNLHHLPIKDKKKEVKPKAIIAGMTKIQPSKILYSFFH